MVKIISKYNYIIDDRRIYLNGSKVAINGFGRIGRLAFRLMFEMKILKLSVLMT